MRVKQITRDQVHQLIGGALTGYEGLIGLDGKKYCTTRSAGAFRGVGQIEFGSAGTLDSLVGNIIGLTMQSKIGGIFVIESGVLTIEESQENIKEMFEQYQSRIDNQFEQIAAAVAEHKAYWAERVNNFNEAMTELKDGRAAQNVTRMSDAISRISNLGIWSSQVAIDPIYDAVLSMKELAGFAEKKGIQEATPVREQLQASAEDAKLDTVYFGFFKGAPVRPLGQVYSGNLDVELIARDMLNE
ncbi:MAG: hypothetical protein H6502_00660 [Candidatus Woesearchaeota archaeon]|nr:MAG: hypothetical protein H6502_00660 [Candidatus Woesearchaeota archaeon]